MLLRFVWQFFRLMYLCCATCAVLPIYARLHAPWPIGLRALTNWHQTGPQKTTTQLTWKYLTQLKYTYRIKQLRRRRATTVRTWRGKLWTSCSLRDIHEFALNAEMKCFFKAFHNQFNSYWRASLLPVMMRILEFTRILSRRSSLIIIFFFMMKTDHGALFLSECCLFYEYAYQDRM